MRITTGLWIVMVTLVGGCSPANILGLFHFQGKSHFVMFEALMKGLAAKGHNVTVVSHFPQNPPLPNYTDLSLKGSQPNMVNNITIEQILDNWRGKWKILRFIWTNAGVELCDEMFRHPVIQNLLSTTQEFDVLITELWGSDCFLGLAHKWGIPHISMISTMEVPWALGRYGSPYNPAVQTNHYSNFSPRGMSFWQRLYNTVFTLFLELGYTFYSEVPTTEVIRQHLGPDAADMSQVVANSSLLFVNTHFSLVASRPLSPNVIEVGGLHIPEQKPLPKEIQKYLDEAEQGVILFSLGSLIKSESFEQTKIQSFVEVFRRLPQNVLWKFDGVIKNQPANLKITKWLPQSDVLRHPNVKLFITHGGLMGTQEAVLAGVPMVGIPFFADQKFNIDNYKELGIAVDLELEDINEENVAIRINTILDDNRFQERAQQYAKLFNDRPLSALNTAIFWTEYVIRHRGAPHLRSAATELTWYQYHLLDVIGVLIAIILAMSFFAYFLCCLCIRIFFSPKVNQKQKQK